MRVRADRTEESDSRKGRMRSIDRGLRCRGRHCSSRRLGVL